MSRPLRVGLIGLGVISRFYVAALAHVPETRLTAVCDRNETLLEPFHGRIARYGHHSELLDDNEVDAVVVTVPNDAHFEICRDALDGGFAVGVEKPLATRLADAHELALLARRRGLGLFTVFHRSYNANVLALAGRLPPGVPIESVRVRYRERIEDHVGRDRWYLDAARCGGGCVADNGPNAFDLVRLFVGATEVADTSLTYDEQGVDRQAIVVLRAASGVTAQVELDWSYPDGEQKDVLVRLADGSVHEADMLAGYSEFKGSLWHEYVGVLQAFVQTVDSGPDRAEHGLAALELVDTVYRRSPPPRRREGMDRGVDRKGV